MPLCIMRSWLQVLPMTRATDSVASVPPRGLAQSGRLAGEPEFVGRRSRIGKRVIAANIVIAALLASLVVVSLSTSRPAYFERADDASANLARTVRVSVQSELARVDLALRGIVLAFELNPARSHDAGSPAAQVLAQQQALLPEVGRFGLADAEGVVGVARPAPPTPTERIGGKDFFLAARSLPAGLVLSEPALDPASQKWVLVLARPLRDAAGAFAGVAYAELAAEHFQTLFAGLDLGSDGAISLRSGSMNLIARRTAAGPATSGIGSNTVSPQLQEAIRAQPLRGAYVARTALDKIERANAYVRLDEPALYVIVGLGTEEYLAPWRNHAAQSVALALLGLLGVGGSSWLVYRNWAREARAAERCDAKRTATARC